MAAITTAQKILLTVVGKTVRDTSVVVQGVRFSVSPEAEIVESGENFCKVHGLVIGQATVTAEWTRPDDGVVLSATKVVDVTPETVVTLEIVEGPVEDA